MNPARGRGKELGKMIVTICRDIRIISTDYCWCLQRLEGKRSQKWVGKSWFRDLPAAARAAAELTHRSIPGEHTLQEAADALNGLVRRYAAMIEGAPRLVCDVDDAA